MYCISEWFGDGKEIISLLYLDEKDQSLLPLNYYSHKRFPECLWERRGNIEYYYLYMHTQVWFLSTSRDPPCVCQ